jgi:hypothetical protein
MITLLFLGLGLTNVVAANRYAGDTQAERRSQRRFGWVCICIGAALVLYKALLARYN